MIRFNRPVFGVNVGALYNGQKISLHAFARNIRALGTVFPGYLIYLVQKDNSRLLNSGNGFFNNFVHIHQSLGLFQGHHFKGFRHLHPPAFGTFREHTSQHILKIYPHFFHPDIGKNFHRGHAAVGNVKIHIAAVEFTLSQHAAQFFPG